jgi:co-chaperonin GroES (HSP10)
MTTETLFPLIGKVILEVETPAEKTEHGLIVPEMARKQKNQGLVIAVNGIKGFFQSGDPIPTELKVDDVVIFNPHGTSEVEVESKKFLVVNQDAVLLKILPKK